MSWNNRSEWHIDHKIPLASAKTKEDVIRLGHYTNLVPLWSVDNLKRDLKFWTFISNKLIPKHKRKEPTFVGSFLFYVNCYFI